MKRRTTPALLLAAAMVLTTACNAQAAEKPKQDEVKVIQLSSTENGDGTWSHSALLEGEAVREYDYTWHADPSQPQDEAVYIPHDIFYYPQLPQEAFKLINYDGEQEWVYYYTAEGYENYIFATLPGSSGMGRGGGG